MKSFTFSDLARCTGKVLDEAMKSPVALTKHGEERLVLVPAETFNASPNATGPKPTPSMTCRRKLTGSSRRP